MAEYIYFSGREPDFTVPLHLSGTKFQKEVWNMLCIGSVDIIVPQFYGFIKNQLISNNQKDRYVGVGLYRKNIAQILIFAPTGRIWKQVCGIDLFGQIYPEKYIFLRPSK